MSWNSHCCSHWKSWIQGYCYYQTRASVSDCQARRTWMKRMRMRRWRVGWDPRMKMAHMIVLISLESVKRPHLHSIWIPIPQPHPLSSIPLARGHHQRGPTRKHHDDVHDGFDELCASESARHDRARMGITIQSLDSWMVTHSRTCEKRMETRRGRLDSRHVPHPLLLLPGRLLWMLHMWA